MQIRTTWDGAAYKRAMRREFSDRLERSSTLLRDEIKDLVSQDGPAVARFFGRPGTVHSLPWDPPLRQTGALWRSYMWEQDLGNPLLFGVGSPLNYARFLELGTRVPMLPRPHVLRSLRARQADLAAILCAPL